MRTVRWALPALVFVAAACSEHDNNAVAVAPDAAMLAATADWPEMPSAFAPLNERPFNSRASAYGDTKGSEGWSSDERVTEMRIVSDASAPRSPSSVGEFRIGTSGDGHASASYYYFSRGSTRALHYGMWVKIADSFEGRGNNDIVTLWLGGSPKFLILARGSGKGALAPAVVHNGSADSRNMLTANVAANAGVAIQRGRWQRWELIVSANTPGSRNGVLVWSIDGKRVLEYGDLGTLSSKQSDTFEELVLSPGYINSGSGPASWVRVDHASLATSSSRLNGIPTAPGTTPTPTPTPVASVSVDPSSSTITPGGTVQLSATTRSASGDTLRGRSVTWASSAPSIATVSSSGQVTAVATGSATITATSEGRNGTAAINVTQVAVASVATTLAKSSLPVGQTTQATATARDANGNALTGRSVSWTSSNPAVATVSTSGLVTAVAAGSANIVATIEGRSGQAALTVTAPQPVPVATVTASLASASLTVGATTQASAVARDAGGNTLTGRTVTWSSSNTAVATVSTSGLVTAVAAGSANIVATIEGRSGQAALTVTASQPVPVASVTASLANASLTVGATTQASAIVRDASGNTLTGRTIGWSSSNTSVATVNASGLVTAVSAGSANIVATVEGRTGQAALSVTAVPPTPPPAGADAVPGGSVIFNEGFESGSFNQWDDRNNPTHRIVNDAALARSGSRVLEVTYPAGGEGGYLNKFFMPGYDSVYVSLWVRYPTEWRGGGYLVGLYGSRTDNQWSGFGRAGVCPNGTDFFNSFLYTEPSGNPGPTRFYTYYVGMPTAGGCYGHTGSGVASYTGSSTMSRGGWQRVEFFVRANTVGQADGYQRFWINGALGGQWNNIRHRTTSNLRINALQLTFNYANGAPQTQRLYVDDIQIKAFSSSGGGSGGGTPQPAPVSSVTLNPTSASLVAGETRQFNATTRDASGNTLTGRSVTWSSSNTSVATVSSSGLVTARVAGNATITATSEGRSGSASVSITNAAPAPVATVSVSPSSGSITTGGTLQLSATLRDASGATLTGRSVSWSTSNSSVATVSSSGVVSGVAAGSVSITASSEGRTGTASISVTAPSTPPPGGGSGNFANEPSGMTVISDYGFDAMNGDGWSYRAQHASARITQDAGDNISPSNVLEFVYPAGFTSGGHAPAVMRPRWSGSRRELYWGFNWKASPGFQNHSSGINKLLYGWVNGSTTFGLVYLWSNAGEPGYRQQMGFFHGGSYFLVNQPACANMRLLPGDWHRIEFHYRLSSSSGARDGSFRLWMNGTLCSSYENVATLSGSITDTYIEPTWGGVGGQAMSTNHYYRFGHVRISAR